MLFIAIVALAACGKDNLDIPNTPIQGKIDGAAWKYKEANGFRLTADDQYRVRFISANELVSDPCTLPSPGQTHVKAVFRPAIGSFSISPIAIDNNQVQVAFEISNAKSLIATSGFMEIFDINNRSVIGYLQAELDETNKVEGAFEVVLCD